MHTNWKRTAGAALLTLMTTTAAAIPALAAGPLQQEIPATRALPPVVTMNGKIVAFDQEPVVLDGVLMLPLRAVVEASGGTITWDGETRTVFVRLQDRQAYFVIGADEAEMNEDNVRYIQRNMIKMARPASIIEGRTLISADALTQILGFGERPDRDLKLDLVPLVMTPVGEVALAQVAERSAVPVELTDWAATVGKEAGSKAVVTEKGTYLAIAGGLQNSGGWTIEIVGDIVKQDGAWLVNVKVAPPTGPATMALTNPIEYFFLPAVEGEVQVQFMSQPTPTLDEKR